MVIADEMSFLVRLVRICLLYDPKIFFILLIVLSSPKSNKKYWLFRILERIFLGSSESRLSD